MNNINLKECDFNSVKSYNAFLYAIQCAKQCIELYKKGYSFYDVEEGSFVEPNIKIKYNANSSTVTMCSTTFAGDQWDNNNKIYCTKQNVNSFLKRIKIVSKKEMPSLFNIIT